MPAEYPSTYQVLPHDIDELKQRAEKALAFNKSPHAKVEVPVEAHLLLSLLKKVDGRR